MAAHFKQGDQVQLISGSLVMTVQRAEGDEVEGIWFMTLIFGPSPTAGALRLYDEEGSAE